MSGFVMGLVKLRAIERSCKMILMCMADNGNDQGHNIYRSMEYLAREACCHKRTVQKKIGQMVRIGLLVDVGRKTHGRGHLRNFRLDLDALLTLFPDCHKVAEDVDPAAIAGLLEDAEAEAKAAGWVPPEERQQEAPGDGAGTAEAPEKGGAGPSFSGGEKGGAEDQKGGAGDTKGWRQGPPEPLRTVIEPNSARAGARGALSGKGPDGPPREPGDPPGDDPSDESAPTLAAEWRELSPQIIGVIGESAFRFTLQDAFVTERREIRYRPARPIGAEEADAIGLQLAMPDRDTAARVNGWRDKIFAATGLALFAAIDPRALAARARREDREKAERAAAQQPRPSTRRKQA